MTTPILRTTKLTERFGAFKALYDVDLELESEEIRAVIGPNGAGKTTLVNALSGMLRPSSGTIAFKDHDITRWPMARRARAGLVRTFQTSSLFPELSVGSHVEIALGQGRLQLGRSPQWHDRIADILKRSGFIDRRATPARALAHGERRRLALEMTLVMEPKILMLDEPMAGLTANEAQAFIERLQSLEDVTLLIVEHDMDVVFQLADRITVLHRGQVLAEGEPSEIERNADVQSVYLGKDRHARA